MNLIETLRAKNLAHERSKIDHWTKRKQVFRSKLPSRDQLTAENIVALGDHLSSVFQLPKARNNRGQSALSGGGSVWTALVGYYLNLCLAGTDAIALSGPFIPSCFKDALKVTHASSTATKLNSDIDLIVVNVPNASAEEAPARRDVKKIFAKLAEKHFKDCSAIVIQTKTNWNDNAQVPMLWNLIYKLARQGNIPENGIAVGSGRYHIRKLQGFGYSFVTVPTQSDLNSFKVNSTPVVRVRALTCGAYWGHATRNGIMQSLSEFFNTAYNLTNHNFPEPDQIGCAYRDEVLSRSGSIPLKAFGLF